MCILVASIWWVMFTAYLEVGFVDLWGKFQTTQPPWKYCPDVSTDLFSDQVCSPVLFGAYVSFTFLVFNFATLSYQFIGFFSVNWSNGLLAENVDKSSTENTNNCMCVFVCVWLFVCRTCLEVKKQGRVDVTFQSKMFCFLYDSNTSFSGNRDDMSLAAN